jgi:hypothetical protein
LDVEVTNVSPHGFLILVDDAERFVSFKAFPWFRDASIRELTNVEFPSADHLYWPHLDVDLAVDSLDHPERYPLVSRAQPDKRPKPAAATVKDPKVAYKRTRRSRRRVAAKR